MLNTEFKVLLDDGVSPRAILNALASAMDEKAVLLESSDAGAAIQWSRAGSAVSDFARLNCYIMVLAREGQ